MTITSPTIDWHAVALAELHPLRVDILELLARGGETSPKDIANQLDEDLGVVSYHVKALAARGLVRETRTEPRRGALAHFYVLTDKARLQPATVAPVSRRGGGIVRRMRCEAPRRHRRRPMRLLPGRAD